jgi:hypothetical protein
MNGSTHGFRRNLYPFDTNNHAVGATLLCQGYGLGNHFTQTGAGVLRSALLPIRGFNFSWYGVNFDLALDPNASGQFLSFGDSGSSCLHAMPDGQLVVAGVSEGFYSFDGFVMNLVSAQTIRDWYEGHARWWEHTYEPIGGRLLSGPAVASWGDENLHVFARTRDGLMMNARTGANPWTGWSQIRPEAFQGDPAAVSWGYGRIDVFVNIDDQINQLTWNGIQWSNYTVIPNGWFPSSPAVTSRGPGLLDLFARGFNNILYHNAFNGSSWSGWTPLVPNQTFKFDPAANSWAPGLLDVYAVGTDGKMYGIYFNGAVWSVTPEDLGGWGFSASPAASTPTPGRVELFGRGDDGRVYNKSYTGSAWTPGWDFLDWGVVGSAPDAVGQSGQANVVVRGTDGQGWWLVTH